MRRDGETERVQGFAVLLRWCVCEKRMGEIIMLNMASVERKARLLVKEPIVYLFIFKLESMCIRLT